MQPTIADTLRALALTIIGHLRLANDVRRVLAERLNRDAVRAEALVDSAERWRIVGALELASSIVEAHYWSTACELDAIRTRLVALRLDHSQPSSDDRALALELAHARLAGLVGVRRETLEQQLDQVAVRFRTMQLERNAMAEGLRRCVSAVEFHADLALADIDDTQPTPSLERVEREDAAEDAAQAFEQSVEAMRDFLGAVDSKPDQPEETSALILGCRDALEPGQLATFTRTVQTPLRVGRFYFEAYDTTSHEGSARALELVSGYIGGDKYHTDGPYLFARPGAVIRATVRNVGDRAMDVLAMVKGWSR